ncbi:DUF4097 domain-containing protein [Candidatus Saccharibacteria bacterium]|nr:DUF4097 domain-containing protein [Candidatus Saccharibacteria bacterium]
MDIFFIGPMLLALIPALIGLIVAAAAAVLSLFLAPAIFFFFIANEVAHDRMPAFTLLFALGIALLVIPLVIMAVRAIVCGIKNIANDGDNKAKKDKADESPSRSRFILPTIAGLGLAAIIGSVTISALTHQPFWPALTGNLSLERPEQQEVVNTSPHEITNIAVHLSNSAITIRTDDQATEVSVRHHNIPEHMTVHTELNYGTLNVHQTYFNRWPRFNFFNLRFQTPHVEIIVPADFVVEYLLETRNGRITINGIQADALIATTSNGAIDLNHVAANRVDMRTSNGRITFTELESQNIQLNTSNGRIEGSVYGNLSDFRTNLRTRNGRIMVNGENRGTNFTSADGRNSFDASTSNGRIEVTFLHGADSGRLSSH